MMEPSVAARPETACTREISVFQTAQRRNAAQMGVTMCAAFVRVLTTAAQTARVNRGHFKKVTTI